MKIVNAIRYAWAMSACIKLYTNGEFDLALNKLKSVEKISSKKPAFFILKGMLHYIIGNFDHVINNLQNAINIIQTKTIKNEDDKYLLVYSSHILKKVIEVDNKYSDKIYVSLNTNVRDINLKLVKERYKLNFPLKPGEQGISQ